MRRLPHRSFGLFRGWTGSCQARGQEEPLGWGWEGPGTQLPPEKVTLLPTSTGSASKQPCMEPGPHSRDRDSSPCVCVDVLFRVYTVPRKTSV